MQAIRGETFVNILIRADASVFIGSGHIMRCLTLADELRARGAEITFICRDWEGNLQRHIESKGYFCVMLERPSEASVEPKNDYAAWLGASKRRDVEETLAAIEKRIGRKTVDWCVTDHYGIDAEWQGALRSKARRSMAIDDIANRDNDCDLLLDQNLYDNPEQRYQSRIPPHCRLLLGPDYALLRPEFREARARLGKKLLRGGVIQRIMVFFGGSDQSNETAKAVKALQMLNRNDGESDIIVGVAMPRRAENEDLCADSPNIHFHCQVPNMADFMIQADLALGAGGSTTWERCCLGLPTLAVIIAENQAEMTETAARRGLQWSLGYAEALEVKDIAAALRARFEDAEALAARSLAVYSVVDGFGASRAADMITTS